MHGNVYIFGIETEFLSDIHEATSGKKNAIQTWHLNNRQ